MSAQRGQALAEAAVAVVLLAAAMSALPIFAAYHDTQRAALRGARDAGFLAAWLGQRSPAAIDASLAETLTALPWRHMEDGRVLVDADERRAPAVLDVAPPGRAAALLDFIAAPLRAADGYLGEQFALTQRGFVQVRVDLRVPPVRGAPPPFSSMELPLSGEAAVLTDAWNAGGSAQVSQRVAGLVPSAKLREAQSAMRPLRGLLQLIEPAFEHLCPGLIEPELVPRTRLGAAQVRVVADRVGAERCR